MADPKPKPGRGRFGTSSFRILKDVRDDLGYPHFDAGEDLAMLVAFLERFDRLGWFPPIDLEKQRLLATHDVIMHVIDKDLCFYEFCSKGGRGERDPWLSTFFHVDANATIRICGLVPTARLSKKREFFLEFMRVRVKRLGRSIARRKEQ